MQRLAAMLIVFCGAVLAQDAPAPSHAERRREAGELRERAKAMRQDAENQLATAKQSCWQKFLVTRCIDEAKVTRQERLTQARAIEQQARAIERDLRQAEHDERQARWAEDTPRHEAEAAQRAEKNRQAQEDAMRRVERKQAEAEQRQGKQ